MKTARLVVVIALVVIGSGSLTAQKAPDLENGFKNYGSYDGSHLDTVNLMNGNLILHAPLLPNYPQRGSLSMQPMLSFNAKTWQVICGNTPDNNIACGWFKGGTGVALQRPTDLSIQRTIDIFFSGTSTSFTAQGYSLTGADGAAHQLFPTVVTNGVYMEFESMDTSAYHVVMSGSDGSGVPSTATITDRHGIQYVAVFPGPSLCGQAPQTPPLPNARIGGGYAAPTIDDVPRGDQFCPQWVGAHTVIDSNGNIINAFNPANNLDPGTDSLGRAIPLGQIALTTDYSGCVSTSAIGAAYLLNYIAPDGSTRQIKMCFAGIPIQTAFNQSGVLEYPGGPTLPPGSNLLQAPNALPPLATVILADGTKWVFTYDNYGELTSVGLPTGGSISYTWTTVGIASVCQNGPTQKSRAVATRTLDDGQGHTSTWTYNWGAPVSGILTNTVTDPLLNDTEHIFSALDGLCSFYETSTKYYQGAKNPSHLLKQVDTTYYPVLGYLTDSGEGVIGNVVPKDITTTVFPSGKVSKIHREHDTGLGTGKPIFGNVKKELEYDWGQGTPGALLRETDTTYQWEINSAYLTAHQLDLPASVIVKDAGGNRVAETDYSYDEPGYLTTPTPAINTQHNSAPPAGVRGNQTTVSRWLNTTNSFIASHTNWYDTGEVYQAIDPLGHTTTHSYDPFYKGAYATQTCSPAPNNIAHCVSGTYDFNTGVLTSLTNENASTQASGNTPGDAAHTSNYTYDFMFRIISGQAPPDPANNNLHAQTNFTFSSPGALPITVQRSKSVTTALSDSATNFFDGLGRGYKGQHVLPNGTATVDTTFDLAGHPATVSNPYFSTSDATYGLTTNVYDGLDRVTQTTKQDGSISSVAYNVVTAIAVPGDCTQTTDEAGKQRRACVDGLGRLVEVDETGDSFAGSQAGGSFAVSGTLQSGSRATGSVTIQGGEQSKSLPGDPGGGCDPGMICDGGGGSGASTLYDTGTVTITVNGHAYAYVYNGSDTATDTTGTVASGLAAAINADSSAVVTASASGAIITLTAKAPGPGGNVSLASSYTWDTADFASASFTTVNSGAALTGGSNSGGVFDAGTMTVVIGTFTASVPYGNTGNSTLAQVASALAAALSVSNSPVTASASGSTVSLTYKTLGTSGNVTVSCSSATSQGAYFLGPSFTCPASFALSNGFNPQSPSLDHAFYATLYFYDALGNLLCVEQHGDVTGTGCSAAPSNDATSPWRVRRFTYDSLSRLLTAKNPESGTISYTYDNDGELLQKTSPLANQTGTATQTVSYCYDELHRVTGKGYGAQSCPLATPVVTYAYDSGANAKGHLTSLTDQAGTASYTYDILGRLGTETRTLTGANNASIPKTVSYEYNLDGSLYKLHYPSGAVVTYTPDSAGRTLSAVDSGSSINYVTGATYGPDSALTGFISGNSGTFAGITNSFAYNKRLQPLTMSATAPSQTVFSIGYDFHAGNGTAGTGTDNGNVFGITNYKDTSHGRDQTFTYDALNRVLTAQNAGTDCTAKVLQNKTEYWGNSYGYDAWGNLLQKTITKCGAEHLSVTADAHNWLHASGTDYQYDAAGNMTYDATASLSYNFDQENRLTGAAGYTYTYDVDGNRVRKSNGSTGTLYWYMTPGIVGESDLSGNLTDEYVFFDGERVARKSTNGVFYYFSDHLKTASVVTDALGNIKSESDFYPWGGELQFVNNDTNHYKFTGKERDTETGLDYFGARYYSNGLGRWVSADWSATPVPVPYADFGDPQSLNQYGYVRNVPTTNADADGHDCGVCLKLVEKIEQLAQDPKIVATALAGTAKATAIEGSLVVGGTAALAAPSVGGMAIVVLGPKYEVPEGCGGDCSSFYIPAPQAEGQNQQGQTQNQDQGQETEHTPDPAPASGGAQKGGGPKPGSTDGPGSGKRATPSQRNAALKENGGKCVFCGKKATEVDHSIPKSRNGDTTTKNLQPACQYCNRQKGAKTSTEYEKWKKDKDSK